MIRKLLFVFSIVLGTVGVAWGQNTTIKTGEDLQAAVKNAAEGSIIQLEAGTYTLNPGKESVESETGWYLPITKKGLTIKGAGIGKTFIVSGTDTPNGALSSQNFITVFAEGVTLEGMTITSKKEVNKVIQVVAKGVTLKNLEIKCPANTDFAGSIYFGENKDGMRDLGTVTMENLILNKGRITFTYTQAGAISMKDITIDYQNVKVAQNIPPIGALPEGDATFSTIENVKVILNSAEDCYHLDNATIVGLPAGAALNLAAGNYPLTQPLFIDKALTMVGAGRDVTHVSGQTLTITATDKAEVTFENIHFKYSEGNTTNKLMLIGAAPFDQTPLVKLTNCLLDGADRCLQFNSIGAHAILDNTQIDGYHYAITIADKKNTLEIKNGCKIQGWAGIMTTASGFLESELTSGASTTNTTIRISDSELISKLISNENYGVIVLQEKFNGIKLDITNSTLTALPNASFSPQYSSILDIRSYGNQITVDDSRLNCENGANSEGGAVVSLGWYHADFGKEYTGAQFYEVKDYSTPKANTISIRNSEVKMRAGERSVLTKRIAKNQPLDDLSINGQKYTVALGNVYRQYQEAYVNNKSTVVDDSGNPIAVDAASLVDIIDKATAGATIQLAGDITLPKTTGTNGMGLAINKKITLDGNGYTLKAASDFAGYLLTVGQDEKNPTGVIIKNLILDNASKAKGLNVFGTTGIVLSNVTSINSAGAGVVVNNSTVTATDLNTFGNAWGGVNVDKGTPKFTFVSGSLSDAYPIYSEKTDTTGIVVVPAGWEATTTTTDGKSVTVWKKARTIPTLTAPTVGTAEAGKTVSAYLLTDGKAMVGSNEIAGVFAWANPDTIVTTDKKSYAVVFTPVDLVTYATATTYATFGEIKQYFTITTGKCANGEVVIKDANPANRYEANKAIIITAVPENDNYEFAAWGETYGVTGATGSYTPTANKELTATFKAKMRTVTIAASGSGSVYVDGVKKENTNTVSVPQGSSIAVTTIADGSNVLDTLYCSADKRISSGAVVVDKDFTITAKFKALPAEKFAVNATTVTNGKILLFDAQGAAVTPGIAVDKDAVLSVVAVPDMGYEINAALSATGSTLSDGKCKITAATTFACTFKPISYAITITQPTGGTITVTPTANVLKAEGGAISTGSSQPFGTDLTATVAPTEGYKFLSLVVNGKEIPNGGTFKVAAATTIQATMRKLAEVAIDATPQTFVYDGTAKKFVVKTTPAGLGGFTVTYNETPVVAANHDQKAYSVTIKRDADNTYAAVDKTITDGLVILAADPEGVAIPTASSGTIQNNEDALYAWKNTVSEQPIEVAVYTPTNASLKKAEFSIVTGQGTPVEVTYQWPSSTSSARKAATKADVTTSLTVSDGVTLWNGTTQLTSGKLYATQVINLKANIPVGCSEEVKWTINSTTTTAATASIELQNGANTVVAEFIKKAPATFPGMDNLAATYDGTIFGDATNAPSVKKTGVSDNWQIEFQQGGTVIAEPTEAGTYNIVVSRPADAKYAATNAVTIGDKFVISPKAATVTGTLAATTVLKGQTLAQSVISGAADVDGVFSWATPNTVADGTAQAVVFAPTNANYKAPVSALTATAKVTETGVTLQTLNLAVTNPDKGDPVVITLNGTPAASGAIIEVGDKLKVTFKATSGYTASATINGAAYISGAEYTVAAAGNVDVKVSYTSTGGGGTPEVPSPDVTDVTGVSLNATTKALAVGAEFTLVATVAPTGATNKGVTWASSDPAIASVNANGKVKALKAGACKITVTTNDGSFTAICDVTVSIPTGIDEILANTRVYTEGGAICIAPARPVDVVVVNMTGVVLYSGQVTDTYRVPASSGVYLVKLSDGRKEALVKVFVR